jgi:hypothetical protein
MRRVKVAKVYKTGRFVLEGSQQQYRARRAFFGGWEANPTGDTWRQGSVLKPITPELLDEVAGSKQRYDKLHLFSELSDRWRTLADIATDAEIKCLKGLLERAKVSL